MKGKMTLFLLAYGLIHTARLGATVADMLKDPALLAHVPGVADAGAHIRHYTKDDEPRAATTRGLTV